ncbi:aldehyde dehydrogenase family protein [Cognatishimia sp. SS12]|uniref:aldehyde dehydrogenase family protein n=1 Tax=Cognatishimia sp. SS12 TaxID=2979465 RepID=UPI00232C7AA4|nr:aldehyde dehydrogenase family protein [Cognatishimia sp. SS12]MDC0739555.1 aldehyde dehydrogenase family protein [Cognatishimia sp. SS12]
MTRFCLTINGQQVETPEYFDVINPATEELAGRAPAGEAAHMEQAINAAAAAFETWSKVDDSVRKEACLAIADVMEAHKEELANLITLEQGKPLGGRGSRFEIQGAVAWTRYTAGLDLPVEVLQDNDAGRVEVHRKPIGVIGSITPWNWPVSIATWHFMPAIRAGNTVVLKPSPNTPLATLRLAELISDVLPAGVLNVVSGLDHLGPILTGHPKVDKITFTGSTPTGRKVMQSASQTLKRLTLELGGNDAGIVLPDVDPADVGPKLLAAAYNNNGQTCACLKRIYVHDDIYDAVCDAMVAASKEIKVGNGLDADSMLGPVQNEAQYNIVIDLVEDAKAQGAKVLVGGTPRDGAGYFYPITLVAEARDGMRIVDEEQFGPCTPIIRYTNLDDVIERANACDVGLGGSVWSNDLDKARAVAAQLECGSVWINKHGALQPNAPFGGIKQSGFGVQFSDAGLREVTTGQTMFVR